MYLAEGEEKGCALIWLRLHPDLTSMPVDNPFYDGKPHTGSFQGGVIMHPLENSEHFWGILHIKSASVVFYVIHSSAVSLRGTDLNFRNLSSAGKFEGVRNEVGIYLVKENRICRTDRHIPDLQVHRSSRGLRP